MQLATSSLNAEYSNLYWKNRRFNKSELEGYAKNTDSPTNSYLYRKLTPDFESLLEIGTSSGNRIIQLAEKYPNKKFVGIDINRQALDLGLEIIKKRNLKNIQLIEMDISKADKINLEAFNENGKFDVVFTWATILIIHPKYFRNLVANICSIAQNQIIFIERDIKSKFGIKQNLDYLLSFPNWAHDYSRIIRGQSPEAVIEKEKVPKEIWYPGGGKAFLIDIRLPR